MSPAKDNSPEEPEDLATDEAEPAAEASTDEASTDKASADKTGADKAQGASGDEAAPAKPARRRAAAGKAEAGKADAGKADADDDTPAKTPARSRAKAAPVKAKRKPAEAAFSLVDADLPAAIFDAKVNVPLIHQVVVAQQAAARQGTHSVKTRGEVRGGGRKPYRQKGTGRARQGSTRAPQFAGGGVVHGPVPRSYAQKTPKKMKAAALRGALSDRARHGRIQVVDGFVDGAAPKTRDALAVLNLATGGHIGHNVLVVAESTDQVTWKSLRNAPGVHLSTQDQLNTYDVLVSDGSCSPRPRSPRSWLARVPALTERTWRSHREQGLQPQGHPAPAGGLGEELRAAGRVQQVHVHRGTARQQDADQPGR